MDAATPSLACPICGAEALFRCFCKPHLANVACAAGHCWLSGRDYGGATLDLQLHRCLCRRLPTEPTTES